MENIVALAEQKGRIVEALERARKAIAELVKNDEDEKVEVDELWWVYSQIELARKKQVISFNCIT